MTGFSNLHSGLSSTLLPMPLQSQVMQCGVVPTHVTNKHWFIHMLYSPCYPSNAAFPYLLADFFTLNPVRHPTLLGSAQWQPPMLDIQPTYGVSSVSSLMMTRNQHQIQQVLPLGFPPPSGSRTKSLHSEELHWRRSPWGVASPLPPFRQDFPDLSLGKHQVSLDSFLVMMSASHPTYRCPFRTALLQVAFRGFSQNHVKIPIDVYDGQNNCTSFGVHLCDGLFKRMAWQPVATHL